MTDREAELMEQADQEVQRYRDACQIIQRDYQTMKDRYRHRLARRNSHIKTLQTERDAARVTVAEQAARIAWLLDEKGGAAHDLAYVRSVEREGDAALALAEQRAGEIAILHEAMRRINRELNHMKGNAHVFSAKDILGRALAAAPATPGDALTAEQIAAMRAKAVRVYDSPRSSDEPFYVCRDAVRLADECAALRDRLARVEEPERVLLEALEGAVLRHDQNYHWPIMYCVLCDGNNADSNGEAEVIHAPTCLLATPTDGAARPRHANESTVGGADDTRRTHGGVGHRPQRARRRPCPCRAAGGGD
jgi:hypothetical protein